MAANRKITELWLDAQDFAQKGGWKLDTQFVHLMGGAYLIAADDAGVPVADATASVQIPQAGRYRIWVRDRNWMRSHSPGRFRLAVDGEPQHNVLGMQPSDAWIWEIAGDAELAAGAHTISLCDLTGYFARCASVLITDDLDYVPPREIPRLQRERARIKGLPQGIAEGGDYDVIVAGGGPGGVPAAIAAAREGCRVLIVQNRPVLGGNASDEVGIPSFGAEVAHPRAREGGIAEELMRLRDREEESVGDWMRAMEKLVAAEKNITVLYNTHVCDTDMDGDTIRSVVVQDVFTLCRTRYGAKVFIDCTGDAWVGYYAGAKYHIGREARYEFDEADAPEFADTITMSGCVRSGNRPYFLDTGKDSPFVLPEWCPKLAEDEENFGRVIMGPRVHWWMEAPNDYDDIYDGEETRDALLLVMLGSWDHMKNAWAGRDTIRTYKMNISGIVNGRRESRRLIGDYILTENDCVAGKKFEDTIAYSGWALDIHHPKGIYSGKEGPLYCGVGVPLVNIPYRILYSANVGNLLMAGRNVSATHIAIGTLRVQLTIMTMGQAAGTAAALCVKHGETPRGIYERHLKELQQLLLKNDQYIPGLKNEDPDEVCRGAKAAASSVSQVEIFHKTFGSDGPLVPVDRPMCTIIGLKGPEPGWLPEVWLKLYSDAPGPIPVTVYVSKMGDLDTVEAEGEVFSGTATIDPGKEVWLRFPIDMRFTPGSTGNYMRIWLEPTPGLYWRSIENLSFYRRVGERLADGTWKITTTVSYTASSKRPTEPLADCAPENVVNGVSRILSDKEYEWVSDPAQELPQWIELTLAQPAPVDTVQLVFDTDMTNPSTARDRKFPEVPLCVKDYRVEVESGGRWETVAEVSGNFMRRRVHTFAQRPVEKIRVTVLATCGDKSARITEIRAYCDR